MIYTILGLLMIKSLTIYEISKILEGKISPFYSGSYGSIQSAIKKLLKEGLITFEEKIDNGRNKKIYSITDAGKNDFLSWLSSDMPVFGKKDNALNRLFFFGFLEKSKQIDLLEKYVETLNLTLLEYCEFDKGTSKVEVPEHFLSVAYFQHKTLEYGIDQIKFEIKWYKKQITKIKENR